MKAQVFAALVTSMAAGIAVSSRGPAVAQEGTVWAYPGGAYQLDYGAVGWKLGSPFSYGGKPALVTFDPVSRDRLQGSCLIFESRLNLPAGIDQATANERIAKYTVDAWATGLGYDPALVREFRNELVGGVRVATMVVDARNPKLMRSHYRSFIIAKPDGAYHQELSCSISPNASTTHKNDVVRFVESLRFPPVIADN